MGWNLYYIPDEEPTYEEAINRIGEAAMLDPVLLNTALRLGEGLKPKGQTAEGWWNYYKNAAERMNKDWVRRYKGYVNASSVVRAMIDDSGRNIDLEVDGGINFDNAPRVIAAGADILVAGTAVFDGGKKSYAENILRLRSGRARV